MKEAVEGDGLLSIFEKVMHRFFILKSRSLFFSVLLSIFSEGLCMFSPYVVISVVNTFVHLKISSLAS